MGTFLEERRRSPAGLALVIVGHGMALAALLLAKQQFEIRETPRFVGRHIPDTPPPPPEKQPEAKTEVPPDRQAVTAKSPVVELPSLPSTQFDTQEEVVLPSFDPPRETIVADPPRAADPPAPPLRVAARLDTRSSLQPPYPPAEQRAGREGAVTVRVTIGSDGRVVAVEKLAASSDAFWRATERQALRSWRFRPATQDGRPVESQLTLTVRFKIDARDA